MEQIIKDRIKFLLKAENNPKLQRIEVEFCKRDILYFFKNYLYTDKNSNLFSSNDPSVIPFIPFEFQEELIQEIWSSIHN